MSEYRPRIDSKVLYIVEHDYRVELIYDNKQYAISLYRRYEKAGDKYLGLREIPLTDSQLLDVSDKLNALIPELQRATREIPNIYNFNSGSKVRKIKDGLSVSFQAPAHKTPQEIMVAQIISDKRINDFAKLHQDINIKMNWQGKLYRTIKKSI